MKVKIELYGIYNQISFGFGFYETILKEYIFYIDVLFWCFIVRVKRK